MGQFQTVWDTFFNSKTGHSCKETVLGERFSMFPSRDVGSGSVSVADTDRVADI